MDSRLSWLWDKYGNFWNFKQFSTSILGHPVYKPEPQGFCPYLGEQYKPEEVI